MATVALITEGDAAHRSAYYQAIREVDSITRAALVDPSGATFDEARATIGAKLAATYKSVPAMLKGEQPVMAIVTMVAVNAPAAIRPLLTAGVHVMAEKPACVRVDDFAALARLADRKQVHLMLALANRLAPRTQDARRIVAEGGIGKLYAVQATQVDDQARIHRPDPGWTFSKARAGGGHLSWLGIHTLDMIRYLTGDEVVAVSAMCPTVGGGKIDVEDLALVHLQFKSGAHGSVVSGYLMDKKGHSNCTLWGADGWVRFGAAESPDVEWHSTLPSMRGAPDRRFSYKERGGGYTAWVRETVRAALGEVPPPVTAGDGLKVLRIIDAAYRSAASGATVKL